MRELAIWALQMNLLALVMYFLYHALLRNSAFHQWNRAYLISVPILSSMVPLLQNFGAADANYQIVLPTVVTSVESNVTADGPAIVVLVAWIWFVGVVCSLIKSCYELVRIRAAFKLGSPGHSFTFFNRIHVDPSVNETVRSQIRMHEQVHADQRHTIDLLFYEFFKVLFWFNPVFPMGQRELKELHEYIADEVVNDRIPDYPHILVANVLGVDVLPLANELSKSNLKNRIKMMNRRKTPKHALTFAGTALTAIAACVLVAFTNIGVSPEQQEEEIFQVVEQMPVFAGCDVSAMTAEDAKKCSMQKLGEYVGKHVEYPASAKKAGVEGKVFIQFVVSKDGTVKNAEVKRGVHEEMDAEALRVVQGMPKWTAGQQNGKNVNVRMTLPIMFALPKGE